MSAGFYCTFGFIHSDFVFSLFVTLRDYLHEGWDFSMKTDHEEGDWGQKSGHDSTTVKPLAVKNWCKWPDHAHYCPFEIMCIYTHQKHTHTHINSTVTMKLHNDVSCYFMSLCPFYLLSNKVKLWRHVLPVSSSQFIIVCKTSLVPRSSARPPVRMQSFLVDVRLLGRD